MGHSEPASGLCSVVKILIGLERGLIPPNLHFQSPNKDIPGLNDGRLQVRENFPIIIFFVEVVEYIEIENNSIFFFRSSTNHGHSAVAT